LQMFNGETTLLASFSSGVRDCLFDEVYHA
jgi:hypothetical protein